MAREREAWIRDLKARDEGALEELVAAYRAPLSRYLQGMVRDRGEAEDLAQEAFLRFLTHLDGYRGETSPRAYLFRIATNLALNHLDSARSRREVLPGDLPESPAAGASPLEGLQSGEDAARVREALGRLPPQQRAVVTLRTWADLSFKEIAAALSIAEGTAKAHYFFALRSMRRELE